MRKVVVSQLVRRKMKSLRENLKYRFGDSVSARSIVSLTDAMESLGTHPGKGVCISEQYNIETDYCYLFSGHNYIIYRYDDTTVTILQLFDERQDFMKTLFGLSGRTQESIDYWGD